jgi:hypothetical protein
MNTCKIIALTSLVWFVFDAFLLMYYMGDCIDGQGWGCAQPPQARSKKSPVVSHSSNEIVLQEPAKFVNVEASEKELLYQKHKDNLDYPIDKLQMWTLPVKGTSYPAPFFFRILAYFQARIGISTFLANVCFHDIC